MKKAIFVIAMIFAAFSSSTALASYQTHNIPFRAPYQDDTDIWTVNINSWSNISISGSFNPPDTTSASYTYCEVVAYHTSGSSFLSQMFRFLYADSPWYRDPNINYSDFSGSYYNDITFYTSPSNGSTSIKIDWY